MSLDELDRRIIRATQSGLPLVPRPYEAVGAALGISGEQVRERLQAMLEEGLVRRIGAVPNHYRLGFTANGMSVWDVADERVDELGERIGQLPFVSHCYRRPRKPPVWPYNLFAMLHGRSRDEVEAQTQQVAALLGDACHAMLPYLGQGANSAMEDGLVLARCIEQHAADPEEALQRYEAARRHRTTRIVEASAEMVQTFHHRALARTDTAEQYIAEQWHPDKVRARYDWIYGYDAAKVPC